MYELRFRMAWMESVGCISCASSDNSAAEAAVGAEPYLLSKNTGTKSKSSSKRRRGLKFVSKRKEAKDEFRAVVTV